MSEPEKVRRIEELFQLEADYAYLDFQAGRTSGYFLVDVVSLEKLDEFCAALEADQEAMAVLARGA